MTGLRLLLPAIASRARRFLIWNGVDWRARPRDRLGSVSGWLAAIAIVVAASGCVAPGWIAMRTPRSLNWLGVVHDEAPVPSDRTMLLLRRYALSQLWQTDRAALLEQLTELARREPGADKIYALAELAYLDGRQIEPRDPQRALELHTVAVMNAYLYLFDDRFGRQINPYDPEFRGACDLYNRALESCLRIAQRKGLAPGASQELQTTNQTIEVAMVSRSPHWRPEDFQRFEFVSDYDVTGLQNHYHTYGLGVPLIAVRKKRPDAEAGERYYPDGLSFPVTAFLRIVPHPDGAPNHHVALLELYDPLNSADLSIAGRRVPLETDLSTPLAFSLNQPQLRNLDTSTSGFLHPDATEKAQGLYMLEPYQPGKIPVIMVHGVWSSPITWMEMFNDLRSSPDIRDRYQFWFYLYPTGQPFWYSAAQLRADLARMRETVDPARREAALDQIVLVGHSMGGLVSKMQGSESGDLYWKAISSEPFDQVKAAPEIKQTLASTYFFQPNPSIRRVIFIATPHRGSEYANNVTAWVGNKLITLPKLLVAGVQQLHRDNPAFFHGKNLIDIYTSVDALEPNCPIWAPMLQATHPPNLRYHSIIGLIPDKGLVGHVAGGTDGVVSYTSAHLDGVDSEITVNSEHSLVHRNPLSVLEVRRILLEHLADAGQRTPGAPPSREFDGGESAAATPGAAAPTGMAAGPPGPGLTVPPLRYGQGNPDGSLRPGPPPLAPAPESIYQNAANGRLTR